MRSEGIRHECTVPKTPEQNGVAERMNRTVSRRKGVVHGCLPIKKESHKGITPVEAWTGERPDVSHLRVLECAG
jgi:hypothetical protein